MKLSFAIPAEGQSFSATIREGESFRMAIAGDGSYEMTPVIRSAKSIAVMVVWNAEKSGAQGPRKTETLQLAVGAKRALRMNPGLSVGAEGIDRIPLPQRESPAARQVSFLSGPEAMARLMRDDGTCCVTCGKVTACGCKVDGMSCGSCCSDSCCPPAPPEKMAMLGSYRPMTFAQMVGLECASRAAQPERKLTAGEGRKAASDRASL